MRKKIILTAVLLLLFLQLFAASVNAAIGTYIVTFDPNFGGSAGTSISVGNGESVKSVMPETPTRTGYKFVGWYLDKDGVNEFDVSQPISENLTVYACWKSPLTYCDADGNEVICENYQEITAENAEFSCTEDTFLTFSDDCTETGSILLSGAVTYHLILKDGQSVSAYNVALGNNTSIEIYGQEQGSGTLTLRSSSFGIGVWEDNVCGNITVNGGIIHSSTFKGACIGTAQSTANPFETHSCGCGDITINGGTIYAQSVFGACIGSGYADDAKSYVGNITVNGGDLYLENSEGACIGTGGAEKGFASCGEIALNGGTIHMKTHVSSAIGGGYAEKKHIQSGDVRITGGEISAENFYGCLVGGVKNLTISGGRVTGSCEANAIIRVEDQITVTGGNVALTGESSEFYNNLINCAEASVDPKLMICGGSSESDSTVIDRIDTPEVAYVRIFCPDEISDAYVFSTDGLKSFTAKNKKDDSKTLLQLSETQYEFDGEPHAPAFDRAEMMAWFYKTGTYPTVGYYLSDGVTLTTEKNSGADSDGGKPSDAGTYVIRAELETPEGVLSITAHFRIYEIVALPFSQTEITVKVGETNDSVTYSGPIAAYLEVFDLSDYDIIAARTDPANLKLIITGKSAGTSEIYLEPITTYGFDDRMEFVIPVITVHVIDDSSDTIGKDMEPTSPKTGDDWIFWLTMLAVSFTGIAVCFACSKIGADRQKESISI